MTDCLFCKIAAGDIPADVVHRDDEFTVFRDINPRAPVHLLVIPNHHIASLAELDSARDAAWIGRMTALLPQLAQANGLDQGFRTVVNTGPGGGQEVPHLHYHLLGDVRSADWRGF